MVEATLISNNGDTLDYSYRVWKNDDDAGTFTIRVKDGYVTDGVLAPSDHNEYFLCHALTKIRADLEKGKIPDSCVSIWL